MMPIISIAGESVDHFNHRWIGDSWKANYLTNKVAFQAGYFPLIFQGNGRMRLNSVPQQWKMAWYFTKTNDCVLARLYGRIHAETSRELACLRVRNGMLEWVAWNHQHQDRLFDSLDHVELPGSKIQTNHWLQVSTKINPLPYHNYLGWNDGVIYPENPETKKQVRQALQPQNTRWLLDYLEFYKQDHAFLGRFWIGHEQEADHLIPHLVLYEP